MASLSTARSDGGRSVPAIAITVNNERCLRVRDRYSTCDACIHACGAGAISLKPTLSLDQDACTGCGACLHACPAGVFDGDDAYTSLMETAAHVTGKGTIVLACPRHAKPEHAPSACAAVVRTGFCLAALGPAAYVDLVTMGVSALTARVDACAGCPLGAAQPAIARSIDAARSLLATLQKDALLLEWSVLAGRDWSTRPVVAPSSARLSRRDFLRVAAARPGETDVAHTSDESAGLPLALAKKVPRERRRLLGGLKANKLSADAQAQPLPPAIFPHMVADDSCSACGVCVRLCPTGALNINVRFDDSFTFTYLSAVCTNCGECIDVCDWESLHMQGGAPLGDVLAVQPATLLSGTLQRCHRCNSRFASVVPSALCPVCSFRAKQPFGSAMPPGIQRRLVRPRN